MSTAAQHQIHEPIDIGVLTVIGPELDAALKALALTTRKKDEKTGTIFWTGTVHSQLIKRDYRIVLACVGDAGNPNAAVATTELLANYAPRALLLMGIAAGKRGKTKIGNVALGDRVVASEPAALVKAPDGTDRVEPRPEIDRILHRMEQDVVHYRPEESRLVEIFRNIGGEIPTPRSEQQEEDFASHVAATITTQRSTIAAGEKLLRNPDKIDELRKLHGKIEVIEMEAAGFVAACRQYNALWLVVRGISDFGDQFKDDRFHTFASKAAAAVLADFIAHGLDLGPASPPPGWEAGKRTSEQWLEETRDVIGSGVHLPRHDIEQSVIKSVNEERVTVLVGDSGSGKSALVKAIVGRFESRDDVLCLPAQEAAGLVTSFDLPAALKVYRPGKRMLFVLDGLDRASTEETRHIAAALRALELSSEASPWRLLITCQSAPWQKQTKPELMSLGVPLTKVQTISIESFNDSEIKHIATEVEMIAPILLRDDLRPVMGRPKVLDLLACAAAEVGAPDASQWVGESNLIEWAWDKFIRGGGRGDQHAGLLQRIATRQADERLFAIPMSEFDAPDAMLISDLTRIGILSQRHDAVKFAHDLYGDYARQRYMRSLVFSRRLDDLKSRQTNPLWHRALRLVGLHLLEHCDNEQTANIDVWRNLVRALDDGKRIDDSDDESIQRHQIPVGIDLLLEGIVFAAKPGAILDKIAPDLFATPTALLGGFLFRFRHGAVKEIPLKKLFVVRDPSRMTPDVERMLEESESFPDVTVWSPVIEWMTRHEKPIIATTPQEFLEVSEFWLEKQYFLLDERLFEFLHSRLLASMIVRLAERVVPIDMDDSSDRGPPVDRKRLYRMTLLCGLHERKRVSRIVQLLSGIDPQAAQPQRVRATAPPSDDPESAQAAFRRIGPNSEPNSAFRAVALKNPGANWLVMMDARTTSVHPLRISKSLGRPAVGRQPREEAKHTHDVLDRTAPVAVYFFQI